jgi:hypothetical protein
VHLQLPPCRTISVWPGTFMKHSSPMVCKGERFRSPMIQKTCWVLCPGCVELLIVPAHCAGPSSGCPDRRTTWGCARAPSCWPCHFGECTPRVTHASPFCLAMSSLRRCLSTCYGPTKAWQSESNSESETERQKGAAAAWSMYSISPSKPGH